jgi:hypothetical protein
MNTKRAEDLRWVADEVGDLAVLLRAHGLDDPACKLKEVQTALQSASKPFGFEQRQRPRFRCDGNLIRLEDIRRWARS